jgi:hypothetical protein
VVGGVSRVDVRLVPRGEVEHRVLRRREVVGRGDRAAVQAVVELCRERKTPPRERGAARGEAARGEAARRVATVSTRRRLRLGEMTR